MGSIYTINRNISDSVESYDHVGGTIQIEFTGRLNGGYIELTKNNKDGNRYPIPNSRMDGPRLFVLEIDACTIGWSVRHAKSPQGRLQFGDNS